MSTKSRHRQLIMVVLISLVLNIVVSENDLCLHHNDEAECRRQQYIQRIEKIKSRNSSLNDKFKEFRIDTIAETVAYSVLFEDFVALNRPYKSYITAPVTPINFLFTDITINNATRDYSLASLDTVSGINAITAPILVANNYLRRLNERRDENQLQKKSYVDYCSHWPSAVEINSDRPTAPYKCPAGMHSVLWGASTPTRVVVHSARSSATFTQMDGDKLNELGVPVHVTLYEQLSEDVVRKGGEEVMLRSANEYLFVPGQLTYSLEALDSSDIKQHLLRFCFVDASNINNFREWLGVSGTLFPHDAELARLMAPPVLDVSMSKHPSEMNIAQLRSSVPAGSTADDSAQSSADMSVRKGETDGAGAGQKGDREGEGNRRDRRRRSGAGDFKHWQDSNQWSSLISALTLPTPQQPVVAAVHRDRVLLRWNCAHRPAPQDKTNFGFRLYFCRNGADPPSPLCGNVTVDTQAALGAAAGDRSGNSAAVGSSSSLGETEFSHWLGGLSPDSQYTFYLALVYDKTESVHSEESGTITTQPLTAPTAPFPMPMPRGTSGRYYNGLSSHCVAAAAAVSAVMRFMPPADDGGARLLGYEVLARQLISGGDEDGLDHLAPPTALFGEWYSMGHFQAAAGLDADVSTAEQGRSKGSAQVVLTNLLAGRWHQFKVSAVNSIGASPYSLPSTPLSCGLAGGDGSGPYTVYGRGHSSQAPKIATGEAAKISDLSGAGYGAGPLLVVDFSAESVSKFATAPEAAATASGLTVPFWKCFWNTRPARIESAYVLRDKSFGSLPAATGALPRDEDSAQESSRNKVVIAARGGASFAAKARQAQVEGALALLVVDYDGLNCAAYDQTCLPGADQSRGEGFAAQDSVDQWQDIHVPVGFIRRDVALSLFAGNIGVNARDEL